jgi:hypothetical protein
VEQAVRLGPRDPCVFNRYLVIGKVHLLQSRVEEAIVWLESARIGNPGSPWPYLWLASAYALKGETDRAAVELAEARRLLGEGSFSSIAQLTGPRILGRAESPRLVRSHISCRVAQSRFAGGMTAASLVERIKGSGAHLTVDQCSARSLVTRPPAGTPRTAAIAERASAPCRTSALDHGHCRLGPKPRLGGSGRA